MKVTLDKKYIGYWRRVMQTFIVPMVLIVAFSVALLVVFMSQPFFIAYFLAFFTGTLLTVTFLYSLVLNQKILYGVQVLQETQEIIIQTIKYSKVKRQYTIPWADFSYSLREDLLSSRHVSNIKWELSFFYKRKPFFMQRTIHGWPNERLFEIDDLLKNLLAKS